MSATDEPVTADKRVRTFDPHVQTSLQMPESEMEVSHVLTLDDVVRNFGTFEEYITSQIAEEDMFYLGNHQMAQQIVEQGLHRNREKFTRASFWQEKMEQEEHKSLIEKLREHELKVPRDDTVLQELARRKAANEDGRLATIIYLRTFNDKGQQVSVYIDFADFLTGRDWTDVFSQNKRLKGKTTDLSYYNWQTRTSFLNDSPQFTVHIGNDFKISFKHRKDHRIIHVSPAGGKSAHRNGSVNVTRTTIRSNIYAQVVLYDHWVHYWGTAHALDGASVEDVRWQAESTESRFDWQDAISTAVLEEDLSIARNALEIGGRLTNRTGEAAPMNLEYLERSSLFSQKLEDDVLKTMNMLYDMKRNDLRNLTLGTDDYQDLVKKFAQLLPVYPDVPETKVPIKTAEEMHNLERASIVNEPLLTESLLGSGSELSFTKNSTTSKGSASSCVSGQSVCECNPNPYMAMIKHLTTPQPVRKLLDMQESSDNRIYVNPLADPVAFNAIDGRKQTKVSSQESPEEDFKSNLS